MAKINKQTNRGLGLEGLSLQPPRNVPPKGPNWLHLQSSQEKLDPEEMLETVESDGSDCKFVTKDYSLSSSGASRRSQWGKYELWGLAHWAIC